MDLLVRFGATVRQLRLLAGYSQESFADLLNMHRNYIGTVERGEANVTLENMQRIASGLKLSLGELFTAMESTEDTPDNKAADLTLEPGADARKVVADPHKSRDTSHTDHLHILKPALDRVAEARHALEAVERQLARLERAEKAGNTRNAGRTEKLENNEKAASPARASKPRSRPRQKRGNR